MKIVICLAFLLFAAQANPLAEFYIGFTQTLELDSQAQKDGVQCILQAEDAILTFVSLLKSSKDPESLETVMAMSQHLINELESTIPISCKAAINGLARYWMVLTSNANIKENWEKFHPEIIRALGVIVFWKDVGQFQRTPQAAGSMLAQNIAWLLGVSKPTPSYNDSPVIFDPTKFVPINYKAFFPQFISGFLRSLYMNNQALTTSISQCAVDLVDVALLFENEPHQISERILMETLTKAIGSCKAAEQLSVSYFEKYHVPMRHGLGETLYLILVDAMTNFPLHKRNLMTSVVRLHEGNYEFSGIYAGAVFRKAFRDLIPLKIEMPPY